MRKESNTLEYLGKGRLSFPVNLTKKKIPSERNFPSSEIIENIQPTFFSQCLVDHSGKQFACIHDRCNDIDNCFIHKTLQTHIPFHALKFHPGDRRIWCQQAYPEILRFIDSTATKDFQDYRILFNHRYINRSGDISQFLHEGNLMYHENAVEPVLSIKVFSELGDIKSDDSIVLTIFKYSDELGFQKIFNKEYKSLQDSVLTPRELEIVKLCQQGLSSKMIADTLKLSIHTVKNHKRNSMAKTLTHNITELIHLCSQNQWI